MQLGASYMLNLVGYDASAFILKSLPWVFAVINLFMIMLPFYLLIQWFDGF